MVNNKFWASMSHIFVVLIVIFHFVYIYLKSQLGIEFTDAGAYIASTHQLVLGDLPFRHEILMLYKPYNIVLSQIFNLFPDIGLHALRILNYVFGTFMYATLTLYMVRKGSSVIDAVCISILTFLLNNHVGILEPGYNSLASYSLVGMVGFYLLSLEGFSSSKVLSFFSGVCAYLAVISYPTLVLVVAIFLLLLLCGKFLRQEKVYPHLIYLLLGGLIPSILTILYVINLNLITDWLRVHHVFSASALNATENFFQKLIDLTLTFLSIVIYIIPSLILFILGFKFKKYGKILNVLGILCILVYFGITKFPSQIHGLFILTFGLFLFRVDKKDFKFQFIPYLPWLLSFVVFTFTTYYYTPYRSLQAGIMALPIIIMMTAPFAFKKIPLSFGWVILLGFTFQTHYNNVFRDASPKGLNFEIKKGKLKNIKTTNERGEALTEVIDYITKNTSKGDFLLAYNDLPLLYYLTDTRPAYPMSRVVFVPFTKEIHNYVFDRMILEKRIPTYAIRTQVKSSHIPWKNKEKMDYGDLLLNEFVTKNFTLVKEIFPFQILKINSVNFNDLVLPSRASAEY